MKLKIYDYVWNTGLGDCYLLKQKEDKYLFFVPNNRQKFIITSQISGSTDNCVFSSNEYLSDLEEALKIFKEE